MNRKFRLITRSDFDGLVCAMILKELDILSDIKFVHPKDMQDGKIEVSDDDISTNLPYVDGIHLAFDHHISEYEAAMANMSVYINDPDAPSTARVVFNYFGGREKIKNVSDEILTAVDKADSANYEIDDILNPQRWTLLNYLMDARTGLGRFRNFRVSNYELMMMLIDDCAKYGIDEILALPDVKERVDLYFEQQALFREQLLRVSKVEKDVVVIYLKDEEIIHAGNRFLIYALFPQAKISVHVMWGLKKQNTAITIGKSIVNRSSDFNIGELCHEYGGGGHRNAGTCQLDNDKVDSILPEIIAKLNG